MAEEPPAEPDQVPKQDPQEQAPPDDTADDKADGPTAEAGSDPMPPIDDFSFRDMLRPTGRKGTVVGTVKAQASFFGTTNIQSVVFASENGHYRIPLSDLKVLHTDTPFVQPPGFDDLVGALGRKRVVACCGPNGCGKELTATRALEEAGAKSIRMLPASLSPAEMSSVVAAGLDDGGAFVLPALNDLWLRNLAGPTGQAIRTSAASGQIKIVVITAAEPSDSVARLFEVVKVDYPDADEVLAAYATARTVSDEVRKLAADVLDQLSAPVSPVTVDAVVAEAIARPDRTAAEIASLFTNAICVETITDWIGDGREAGDIALLAAGATLSGAPAIVVQEAADELLDRLQPNDARYRSPVKLGTGTSWPSGLLQPAFEKMNTHFGVLPFEVIEVADPHRPQDVIRAIWQTTGPHFRSQYFDWLVDLPTVRGLGWYAGYTAGVLFAADPALVETRVLRPWLNSGRTLHRRCAGQALGSPVVIGSDPTAARRLAHAWATGGSTRHQQAAIAAYGGLLGAWDTASAAPLKLFVLGLVVPKLRKEADSALASLIVAGGDAVGARTGVISYLKLTMDDRASRRRIFGCLPVIVQVLVRPEAVCSESLTALRAEPENWSDLHGLIATAMVDPAGFDSGRLCLYLIVRASARGQLDQDVVDELLRGMQESQRHLGTVRRLGAAIKRSFGTFARSENEQIKTTATAFLRRFFS